MYEAHKVILSEYLNWSIMETNSTVLLNYATKYKYTKNYGKKTMATKFQYMDIVF